MRAPATRPRPMPERTITAILLCVPPSGITHPDHIQSVYGAILYISSEDTLYYARFGSLNAVGGETSSLTAVKACLGPAAHDLPLCCVLNSYDILAERCACEAQKFGRARAISSASIRPNGFQNTLALSSLKMGLRSYQMSTLACPRSADGVDNAEHREAKPACHGESSSELIRDERVLESVRSYASGRYSPSSSELLCFTCTTLRKNIVRI